MEHPIKSLPIFIGCIMLSVMSVAQLTSDSILVGDHYRKFHYNNRPVKDGASLVFVLHGSTGDGLKVRQQALKLEAKSVQENFVIVYPDGYKTFWNECRKRATTPPNIENIDENSFFEGMIGYFSEKFSINKKRVFVMGTSGGGQMAYKLALTMPEKIKAIAVFIASLPDSSNMDCIEARQALPVMIVNGTADPVNLYEGGEMKTTGFYLGSVQSTEETLRYWATLARHTTQPLKSLLPDTDPSDGKIIEQYTYSESGKPEVTLLKVIGGKHDYPNDIDVHSYAWDFFKRQK